MAPTGKVRLVPLDSAEPDAPGASSGSPDAGGSRTEGTDGSAAAGSGAEQGASGSGSAADTGADGGGAAGEDTGQGAGQGGAANSPDTPSSSAPGGSSGGSGTPAPAGPAALKVSEPELKDADQRWCQDVTLVLRNSGGSAVRSGTVTFETHIIGSLGVDWATIESTEKLPVPIGAGEEKKKTWTVCVESWRVPLGMHVETRDVSVDWK
ncbi:hypothetical protein [Streptomyces sp. cg35]|uniref:hypothetical protein n=1 Tax=Streptomyces sp. cg35 TaxID=3421650 RepID=UPI003D1847B3